MFLDSTDELHLHRALQLAEEAAALASPNPTVGCVIAQGDRILGEGAHLYDNFDHAEIAALKQAALNESALKGTGLSPSITAPKDNGALAPEVAHGATAYVTLEPCAHHGRTPPCSNALIIAGISRCVVATVDPNPLVRGQGIAKLRAAGIVVDITDANSPLAQHARTLNDAFAYSIQHDGLPFVTLKAAVSADGYLAPPASARTAGTPHWLTGEAARADVQHLRHTSDAILTGIGTILADNPSLTDRTGLPRRRPLLRVILDPDLRTPPTATVISADAAHFSNSVVSTEAAHPTHTVISTEGALLRRSGEIPVFSDDGSVLIFCSASAPADREAALITAGAEIIRLDSDSRALDLHEILSTLASRKILSVLVEAGSTLNGSFLRECLVQKLVLYYAPTELGTGSLPFANGIVSPRDLEPQLTRISHATFPHGNAVDTRFTGYLHNPWNEVDRIDI